MITLNDACNDTEYRVAWLTGKRGGYLGKLLDLKTGSTMRVISNLGDGGVVVRIDGHEYAIDARTGYFVKLAAC